METLCCMDFPPRIAFLLSSLFLVSYFMWQMNDEWQEMYVGIMFSPKIYWVRYK